MNDMFGRETMRRRNTRWIRASMQVLPTMKSWQPANQTCQWCLPIMTLPWSSLAFKSKACKKASGRGPAHRADMLVGLMLYEYLSRRMSEAIFQWRRYKCKHCWQIKWTWLPDYMPLHLQLLDYCRISVQIWAKFGESSSYMYTSSDIKALNGPLCLKGPYLSLLLWHHSAVLISSMITINVSMLLISTLLLAQTLHVIFLLKLRQPRPTRRCTKCHC